MNTKQEKLIRLSLTKRLVMSVILSAAMGSTAALACTPVSTVSPYGCPVIGETLNKENMNVVSKTLAPNGSTICSEQPTYKYKFEVYNAGGGLFGGLKGTATTTWTRSSSFNCNGFLLGLPEATQLTSGTVSWAGANGTTTVTAYNPSHYAQCCIAGT